MAAEICDVLSGKGRMRLRLVRLGPQPGDDRDAVVAENHEAVMQVAHQTRELQLQNLIQSRNDGRLSLSVKGCVGHGRLRERCVDQERESKRPSAGETPPGA